MSRLDIDAIVESAMKEHISPCPHEDGLQKWECFVCAEDVLRSAVECAIQGERESIQRALCDGFYLWGDGGGVKIASCSPANTTGEKGDRLACCACGDDCEDEHVRSRWVAKAVYCFACANELGLGSNND